MSDEITKATIRKQVRTISQEEFTKAHTKQALLDKAAVAGVKAEDAEEAKTKGDLTALIYAAYPAPDPSLRGKSTVDEPVSAMWALLNEDLVKNGAEGRMRRKDGVAAGQAVGVAYFTARTQYQAWFEATDRGTKPLTKKSDPNDMPRGLAKAWGLIEEKAEEEKPAKK